MPSGGSPRDPHLLLSVPLTAASPSPPLRVANLATSQPPSPTKSDASKSSGVFGSIAAMVVIEAEKQEEKKHDRDMRATMRLDDRVETKRANEARLLAKG